MHFLIKTDLTASKLVLTSKGPQAKQTSKGPLSSESSMIFYQKSQSNLNFGPKTREIDSYHMIEKTYVGKCKEIVDWKSLWLMIFICWSAGIFIGIEIHYAFRWMKRRFHVENHHHVNA